MFGKENFAFVTEFLLDQIFHPYLFFQPNRHGFKEGLEPERSEGEIRVKQTVEFEEWFFVKSDKIDVADGDAALLQAVFNRFVREIWVVFFARETFFLGGSLDFAVLDEASRAVVVESGNPQDAYVLTVARHLCGNRISARHDAI